MSAFQNASIFIIQSVFDFYLFVLLLRFILQYLRVDYYNPFTQFIIKITSPVIVPLRRIIPGYAGLDMATLLVILGVAIIKLVLIGLIASHHFPNIIGLLLWAIGDVSHLLFKLFFYAILAGVIISWVAPGSHSPVITILYRLTEPVLTPVRRLIPPMGGFDISPVIVLLALQVLMILITDPLTRAGYQWALK